MNRKERLNILMTIFNEEKKFNNDGYYRIRTIDNNTIELAFLLAGPCGETIAHPQITVSLTESLPIGLKLIDMQSSPPLFLTRESSNADQIDLALDALIEKFERLV